MVIPGNHKFVRIETAADVIDAVGGNGSVMALTGQSAQSVTNSKSSNRFAAKTFLILQQALAARGFTAPPALWGITEPDKISATDQTK